MTVSTRTRPSITYVGNGISDNQIEVRSGRTHIGNIKRGPDGRWQPMIQNFRRAMRSSLS